MNSGNLFNGHPHLGQNFSQNGANIPFDATNFNPNDPSTNFNFQTQLYNPQLQQHAVSEANTRHQSPIPQHFPYQTNSVVPAKRPLGLDDVSNSSPRPGQGPPVTNARSQTPQSVHGTQYSGQPGMGPFTSASPFPHMQQQSTPPHGSLPPNMQQQAPRPFQPMPQQQSQHRASPHHQVAGLGMPNDQVQMGNGMGRPQQQQMPQNLNQFQGMQNNQGQGLNVPFNAVGNPAATIPSGAQNTSQTRPHAMQEQQRLYQMQLHQQHQALQARNTRQAVQEQNGAPNASAAVESNAARANAANANLKAKFWQNFSAYNQRNNVNIEQTPMIAGKPIDLFNLFIAANRSGPSPVWPQAARMFGLHPEEYPTASEEIKQIFERYLMGFTAAWREMTKKQAQAQQAQAQAHAQTQVQAEARAPMQQLSQQSKPQQQFTQPTDMNLSAPRMSPPADSQRPDSSRPDQAQHPMQPNQSMQSTQAMQQALNGAAAVAPPGDLKYVMQQSFSNLSMQQQVSRMSEKAPSSPLKTGRPEDGGQISPDKPKIRKKKEPQDIAMADLEWPKPNDVYQAESKLFEENAFGGIRVAGWADLGKELSAARPILPTVEHMGAVDLHALALSIQSSIHSEVRNALDQLVAFTCDTRMTVLLDQCPELLDAFVDCAEDQVSILTVGLETTAGMGELPSLNTFENECLLENEAVLSLPSFGSADYKLQVASDWLIAILTIVRNISFYDSLTNHQELVGSELTHIICQAIRLLMTKQNALRSAKNAQDFMKDVATILSNIGHKVQLSSKDDAYAILQLLLAFVPNCSFDGSRLMFSSYDPRRHQYLPCAVDALAKLLACDDLNRIYFKNIFVADGNSSPPYRLLTRAFAMSISPIPDRSKILMGDPHSDLRLAYNRAPFLSQGMLAADVLASLAPEAESGLAQSWLLSDDCWAPNLMHLAIKLGMAQPPGQPEVRTLGLVTVDRGLSLLQRLLEKSLQQRSRPGQSRSDLATQLLLPCREQVALVLASPVFEKEPLKRIIEIAGMNL